MPGFMLDAQGPETTFKTTGGDLDAINRFSVQLVESITLGARDKSNNLGLASAVVGDREHRVIFPTVNYTARLRCKVT